MITTNEFLLNSNPVYKNTDLINEFTDWHIFANRLIKHKKDLLLNSKVIDIDSRYDFRPDRLAFEIYQQDFWYPAILVANNLGSLLNFKADYMNHRCIIPSADIVAGIMGAPKNAKIEIEESIDSLFK